MQPRPSPISHDPHSTDAPTSAPPTILTLASVTARIGKALVDAERLPPTERGEFLRKIAPEIRTLASKVDALANQIEPIGEVEIVVTCRHCAHTQPTPIDWSAPCPGCGGER